MRLVAHALEQVEALGAALQDHGVVLAGQPHLLEALREPAQGDVVDPELGERPGGGRDLGRTTVDHDEVGRVREACCAARRGVGPDLARPGDVACGHGVRVLRRVLVGSQVHLHVARLRPVREIALEAARDDLVHRGRVVARSQALGPTDREVPVLALAREPVLEHDHRRDLVGSLRRGHVVALDAQRRGLEAQGLLDLAQRLAARGQVAGSARAVQREGVLRVLVHRGGELALVPALGHSDVHLGAAEPREPGHDLLGVRRKDRHEHLAGHDARRRRGGVAQRLVGRAVDLLEEVLDELRVRHVLDLLDDPATLTTDAPAADVEDLDRGLELVACQGEDVRVGRVPEHHGVLLHGALERDDVVAQACRLLVLHRGSGLLHLRLDPADELGRVAGHEVTEVLGERVMVLGADASHARRRALVDVPEQARAPGLLGPLEDPRGARAHREDPQQEVEGLADRPGVPVGAEVPRPGALGAAHDLCPGELLAQRHGQVGVGLVVPVLDVEARVELLDPRVLERERLDLGPDHRPLDRGGRGHHGLGAVVEVRQVLEVAPETRSQVLGLAHVDHASVLVAEPVDTGRRGDLSRGGAVRGRICHVRQPRSAHPHPGWPCPP
ncbi:hypothetical protein OERS_03350 [Oerskovia enterophila]|uniref:Uncharacterized protein n=1 Tax=Oerskovia enterophila TaxID=43678 RepID=A0ABX2Y863_9CELL|nr:hypothetical protein OERS_03350 [Oerskovia enterophila]